MTNVVRHALNASGELFLTSIRDNSEPNTIDTRADTTGSSHNDLADPRTRSSALALSTTAGGPSLSG
jgi:hypothetical protein